MKTKTIILNQKPLTYLLCRRRRASVRITVDRRGFCSVQAPHSCSMATVENVLIQHANWIFDKVRHWDAEKTLKAQDQNYRSRRELARKIIVDCVNHYAQQYGFCFGRIAIKNQSSMWGSCSSRGNLNFHYRVAELPERLRDYVIVHELCHLSELNHSVNFWKLVGDIFPDYRIRVRELRHYSKSNQYALD